MTETVKSARERELEHHIRVLRSALEDAPHSSIIGNDGYGAWYRGLRGPALDSTDPNRWVKHGKRKAYRGGEGR